MKHDFRTRKVAPIKTVPNNGNECNCIECQKSRVYGQMMGKRMQPYTNADNGLNLIVDNHARIGSQQTEDMPP